MTQVPASETRQQPRVRRDSIDFWRGVLFCTIFVNHIPGNVFESLTSRNIGFSDSAEGFIFLAGLSLALAYGGRFASSRGGEATSQMLNGAVRLYGAHIALSLAALAIFGIGGILGPNPALLEEHGRGFVFAHPLQGLIGILSLGHQLGYFNILPLYMLMLLWAPILLWLGLKSVPLMVAVSGLIYALTRARGWVLPTWPVSGQWFFDPPAWQFLLTLGIACGLRTRAAPLPRSPPLIGVALAIVGFSVWSVTNGLSLKPGLQDVTRSWADLDKTMLGAGRLLHFLALAYLVYSFRLADRLRGFVLFEPLCLIGRGSLAMFCFLSTLAAVGQVTLGLLGHAPALGMAVVGAGLAALYGFAFYLDAGPSRRSGRSHAAADREALGPSGMVPSCLPEQRRRDPIRGSSAVLLSLSRADGPRRSRGSAGSP